MPKLTALDVKREKRPGRYGDGNGLWLQVRSLDSKSWLFRYRMAGRAHALGLGPFPVVTLAEARDLALDAARQVRKGVNPVVARKVAKAAANVAGMTFRQAVAAYVAKKGTPGRNAKHKAQWLSTLETYAFPEIGDIHVAELAILHLQRVLPFMNSTTGF